MSKKNTEEKEKTCHCHEANDESCLCGEECHCRSYRNQVGKRPDCVKEALT